jgi:PAS domain S-box-containing protein
MHSSDGDLRYVETRALAQVIDLLDRPACLLAKDLSVVYCNASSHRINLAHGTDTSVEISFGEYCRLQLEPASTSTGTSTAAEMAPVDAPALTYLRLGELYLCLGEPDEPPTAQQAELYRSVVEQQRELICRLDLSGRITFANGALCNYLGSGQEQLCQRRLQDLVAPASAADLDRALTSEPGLLEDSLLELEILRNDAEPRCTRWAVRLLSAVENRPQGLQLNGRDVTDQKLYYEELLKYQEQLRSLTARLITTEEYERRRIADGMNAEVSQRLAELHSRLSTAHEHNDPTALSTLVADSLELVSQIQDNAHALTFELSPPILHDMGFVSALEWLAGHVTSRHGISVEFIDDGQPKQMSNEMRILLYHSTRELLINIVKHARATHAELHLARRGDSIELTVEDDGRGFDPASIDQDDDERAGFGHFTISERLRHLGGQLVINSAPGAGTRVILRAPLAAEPDSSHPQLLARAHPGLRQRPEAHPEIRVLLADEHEVLRDGLKALLSDHAGLEVVAEAGDGLRAVELALRHRPDVVILDASLPGLDGSETTRRILAERPETRVIALSSHSEHHWIRDMLKAGAVGYLLKDAEPADLINAIRSAHSALRCFSQLAFATIIADFIRYDELTIADKQALLSRREREVLGLIADGLATKEIARRLDLSVKTIETYRRRMLDKLNLDNIADLTKYAIQEGLTDINPRR